MVASVFGVHQFRMYFVDFYEWSQTDWDLGTNCQIAWRFCRWPSIVWIRVIPWKLASLEITTASLNPPCCLLFQPAYTIVYLIYWLNDWLTDRLHWGTRKWMSEWVSEWVSGWVSEWVGGWVSGWVTDWVSEWVSECEWMSEWVWVSEGLSGWEWLSGWVSEQVSK